MFQSTPPERTATCGLHEITHLNLVSIHAARTDGDFLGRLAHSRLDLFQSTPPERTATKKISGNDAIKMFQSTPPERTATAES